MTGSAKQSIAPRKNGLLRRFASRNDGVILRLGEACPGCCAAPSARLRASSTRYGGALLIRGPLCTPHRLGPGSAVHRDRTMLRIAVRTLHRVRDTRRILHILSAVAAPQCLGSVAEIRRAGLRRGRRGRAQVSRSFALGPAALIALFFGGHIKLAPFAALQHFAAGQHFQAGLGSAHLLLIGRARRFPLLSRSKRPLLTYE
jgi:hypothetical protein